MTRKKSQTGFSLVETLVAIVVLVATFGFAFKNLAEIRKGARSVNTSGPHLFFESFAASRLKVYFAKLMQWNTHVCPKGTSNIPNASGYIDCLCGNADYFAYAPNNTGIEAIKGDLPVANMTLGLDLRMALSTFKLEELAPGGTSGPFRTLIDLANERKDDPDAKPWGAMLPFHTVDEWNKANAFSRDWCATRAPTSGIGLEMCRKFEACSQVAGGLGGPRPEGQLGSQAGAVSDVKELKKISMCFVFAGNLFTRTDGTLGNSAGTMAIDYPSVVGLAVATATLVNNNTLEELKCKDATVEMNRSMKIKMDIYTAMNVDQNDPKKQSAHHSVRELTGEKLGVAIPNCKAPLRGFTVTKPEPGKAPICIEDPLWIFECSENCDVVTY